MVLHPLLLARREGVLAGLLAGLERTAEAVCVVNSFNTVGRVDVLNEGDLVASRRTLAGDDGAVGEEELPDLQQQCQRTASFQQRNKLTLNQRSPYLATTFSLFAIQFLYHLQRVAE